MLLQFYDVAATFLYCGMVTFLILKVLDMTLGLRVSRDVEIEGLDIQPAWRNGAWLKGLAAARSERLEVQAPLHAGRL